MKLASHKKILLFILPIMLLANFALALNAVAADPAGKDLEKQLQAAGSPWGGTAPSGGTSLAGIVGMVISVILGLLGIIFLVLIIYAGFLWMTAGGDEEKVTKAKETLTRAVIGLIIIVAAGAINWWVLSKLVQPILMGSF